MRHYKVTFTKEWTEHGEVFVAADDAEHAREIADEMLTDGADEIQWSSSMDPGDQRIEDIEDVKEQTDEPS